MTINYLHNHPEFDDLIRIVSDKLSIIPVLVEKDYWIMHCLYGLKSMGMKFYLKGGTSLSKGYKIIQRFSEDIDILIEPPETMKVATGKNQNKKPHCISRHKYYDWLADNIKINGIVKISRDRAFDDVQYRSGGIRLFYSTTLQTSKDIKNGILLEVGFDTIAPNKPKNISSWAYDFAVNKVEIKDNRVFGVPCYHPGYTFVEKLQTISTKFRKQQSSGLFLENFMRHYYDIYCLLEEKEVIDFIGTQEYFEHKKVRFRTNDLMDLTQNQAFQIDNPSVLLSYSEQYKISQSLYYKDKPGFEKIIKKIREISSIL